MSLRHRGLTIPLPVCPPTLWQGRYTYENGVIIDAEFKDDVMVSPPATLLSGDGGLACTWADLGVWSEQALVQVRHVLLRNMGLLRRIYSFYSALGASTSDNV